MALCVLSACAVLCCGLEPLRAQLSPGLPLLGAGSLGGE